MPRVGGKETFVSRIIRFMLVIIALLVVPNAVNARGINEWQATQFQFNLGLTSPTPDTTFSYKVDLTYFKVPSDTTSGAYYFGYAGPYWSRGSWWFTPKLGYVGGWFAGKDGIIGALWAGYDIDRFAASFDYEIIYGGDTGLADALGYYDAAIKRGKLRLGVQVEHIDLDFKYGPHIGFTGASNWKVEARIFRTDDGENILRLVTAIF